MLASLAMSATATPLASASPTPKKYGSRTSVAGLRIAGYDKKVAAAAGYSVRTWPDGRFQLVPYKGARGQRVEPIIDPRAHEKRADSTASHTMSYPWDTGSATGNCGTNFNTVEQTGPHKVYVETGFDLNKDPVSIDWRVHLVDQNGKSYHSVQNQSSSTHSWNWEWYELNQYVRSNVITTLTGSSVTTKQGYICWPSHADANIWLQ